MKQLVFIAMVLMAATSWAHTTRINLNGGGQIRLGGRFTTEPRFLSFHREVERELAKAQDVQFVKRERADFVIDYKDSFFPDTFYSLFPRGVVGVEIFDMKAKESSSVRMQINCAFEVNDGGNVYLKSSCAKRMAKKIIQVLE